MNKFLSSPLLNIIVALFSALFLFINVGVFLYQPNFYNFVFALLWFLNGWYNTNLFFKKMSEPKE